MTEKTSCGRKTKTALKGSQGAERAGPGSLGLGLEGRAWLEAGAGVLELLCSVGWRVVPHHELLLPWRLSLISCWFHPNLYLDMSMEVLGRLELVSRGI